MLSVAIYGVFSGWVAMQSQIDWNLQRPFNRFYSQIQDGMTQEEVEILMRRAFPGRRPVLVKTDASRTVYHLEADDGRFSPEGFHVRFGKGRVVAKSKYLD
jgi:hypothetical protein